MKRAAVAVALTAALTMLTGCNSSSPAPRTNVGNYPHTVVTINDSNRGQTVVLHTGGQLRVILASTYWQFQPPTNETVLSPHDGTHVIPQLAHCVPGGGCGTVIQVYDARTVGSSVVTATRTSCGEAMGCTASTGKIEFFVNVQG